MDLPARNWRPRGPLSLIAALALGVCILLPGASPTSGTALASRGSEAPGGPLVRHTGEAPTGYEVTFRYYDPHATRVQITGEWYFENPSALPSLSGTPGSPVQTPGLLPAQWQPGDVPIQSPNSTGGNFPVADMTETGHSGMWTYTTPLPSGTFTYGFFVDCTTSDQSGCTQVPDPGNPAWTVKQGLSDVSPISDSTVYVPSDPKFDTVDYAWQGPARKKGNLTHITYSSPGHVTPADKNYLVVYTPPGYDPHRAQPYPTLYLNHGGGETEMGWTIQGDAANIMDNLIGTGEIRPMVVVMPDGEGYPDSVDYSAFRNDLIDRVIPLIESRYHVSTSAADRAFTGLSGGGMLTNQLMLHNTDQFQYYGMMSAGLPPGTTLTDVQIAALKKANIFVGCGWQDVIFADGYTVAGTVIHTGPAKEVRTLSNAQIPVTTDFINGGHEWYVWRILLKDFLTRVAFWPSPAATW
jgi:enterochelin esterase-like enzyme